ncbi:MAG TPA: dTDP-4-dehydrorhamnose reductase [Sphingomonas sp.]
MSGPILVTGGGGQIGGELADRSADVVAVDLDEYDITDPASVERMIGARDWAAVINCAAYTAVDKAEGDIATAWSVNATAPALIAHHTAKRGIPMLHVSTDYVFEGSSAIPYRPDDRTGPLGVYGASKLGGEIAVASANPRHAILRTAWVVSARGDNFIKTMRRFGRERDLMKVVADQHGCPTSAADIADTLLAMGKRMAKPGAPAGIWHFVNAGAATWHDLAEAVFADLERREGRRPVLEAITTADYPTPARRPAYSRLDTGTLTRDFGIVPRPWQDAVADIFDALARIDAPAAG